MPRPSKPYFRKQTKSWYCSIQGRQISLGKDRESAFEKFHHLMADKSQVRSELNTLYELTQAYLDWCEGNRKPRTYALHRGHLKSFIEHVGKRLRPSQLKTHIITDWCEKMGVSSTTQNGAIRVVQRMLNWAVEHNYISNNPIKGMKKPRAKRRDIFYTQEQWEQIKSHADESLRQLLDFLYLTGCRPLEARTIEARHMHGDLVIFPTDESKGEMEPRVIYLTPESKQILESLVKINPEGPLFRNTLGNPWTKDALVLRLRRISKKVGFRVIAYGARHSFATNALTISGLDPISLAHLMGHKDTTMVSKVYSHIAKNPHYLRKKAVEAVINRPKK